MRFLVTGAAGFIGSHLCERLANDGHEVTGIDNYDGFYSRAQKELNADAVRASGVSIVEADIQYPADYLGALDDVECVIHLAALAGVRPSFERVEDYLKTNILGTHSLMNAAAQRGVKKFVFASSSSVYGSTEKVPFTEDDPGEALSPYAATKLAGEQLCSALRASFESISILRLFTVYGPRQRPDLAIHKFAAKMIQNSPIPVYGDPTKTYRDYTFVSDIVDGITAAAGTTTPWSVLNLGSGRPISLWDMIRTLESVLEVTPTIDQLPMQAGDMSRTWASIERARQEIRYEPKWTFEDGVASFIEWMKASVR